MKTPESSRELIRSTRVHAVQHRAHTSQTKPSTAGTPLGGRSAEPRSLAGDPVEARLVRGRFARSVDLGERSLAVRAAEHGPRPELVSDPAQTPLDDLVGGMLAESKQRHAAVRRRVARLR